MSSCDKKGTPSCLPFRRAQRAASDGVGFSCISRAKRYLAGFIRSLNGMCKGVARQPPFLAPLGPSSLTLRCPSASHNRLGAVAHLLVDAGHPGDVLRQELL